jgi:hypothetical protein
MEIVLPYLPAERRKPGLEQPGAYLVVTTVNERRWLAQHMLFVDI